MSATQFPADIASDGPVVFGEDALGDPWSDGADKERRAHDVAKGPGLQQLPGRIELHVPDQLRASRQDRAEHDQQQAAEPVVRHDLEQRERGGQPAGRVEDQRDLAWAEAPIEQPMMNVIAVRR